MVFCRLTICVISHCKYVKVKMIEKCILIFTYTSLLKTRRKRGALSIRSGSDLGDLASRICDSMETDDRVAEERKKKGE